MPIYPYDEFNITMEHIPLRDGAWLDYDESWLAPDEAHALMTCLREELVWEERPIIAQGKEVLQRRLIAWAGELPYRYSGQTLEPRTPTETLRGLMERIEAFVGHPFNHAVLNLYRDGRDHMSMHADNEPELGRDPTIASLSLGAARRFVLKPKDKRARKDIWRRSLPSGSLLVMGGRMQHTWRHGVPQMSSLKEERINLTLRLLKGEPGWREPRPDWGAKGAR